MVTFDATLPGTSASEWENSGLLTALAAVDLSAAKSVTVVAAHPDDETLGAGGLIFELASRGIPVTVVAVTDGSASNPDSSISLVELAAIRGRELRDAVAQLSEDATVIELGFPDGRTDENRQAIAARLAEVVPADSLLVAPWHGDGHRDHRVVGELCSKLAEERGATLLEYPIWMWHWATPDDPTLPWQSGKCLELSPDAESAKSRATSRHVSQTRGLGPGLGEGPVLRPDFLEHFEQGRELFFVTEYAAVSTKSETYFDELYERNPDPWRLSTRSYESRKRAITVASLPRESYRAALEIGCSVGELTALLAERADALLALDISVAAVETATKRTVDLSNVTVEHRDATRDFPEASFDLIVLSEVGYYWDLRTLETTIETIVAHLAEDGMLLACHWRHPVEDYPLLGDWVHAAIRERPELHSIVLHEEEDFVLEVFARSAESVARREGLVS